MDVLTFGSEAALWWLLLNVELCALHGEVLARLGQPVWVVSKDELLVLNHCGRL